MTAAARSLTRQLPSIQVMYVGGLPRRTGHTWTGQTSSPQSMRHKCPHRSQAFMLSTRLTADNISHLALLHKIPKAASAGSLISMRRVKASSTTDSSLRLKLSGSVVVFCYVSRLGMILMGLISSLAMRQAGKSERSVLLYRCLPSPAPRALLEPICSGQP